MTTGKTNYNTLKHGYPEILQDGILIPAKFAAELTQDYRSKKAEIFLTSQKKKICSRIDSAIKNGNDMCCTDWYTEQDGCPMKLFKDWLEPEGYTVTVEWGANLEYRLYIGWNKS